MKMNNIKINFGILTLILSLVFIIPLNMSLIYAEQEKSITSVEKPKAKVKKTSDVGSVCGGGANVKDSLILSIVTLCLPGILEKAYEWKQIKCETIKCSYEAVKNDLDPTFCKKQDAYKTCKFIVGELFAIPPGVFFEYLRNIVSQILANPIGAAYTIVVSAARKYLEGVSIYSSITHGIAAIILAISDLASIAQIISDVLENGFFPESYDACEGIEEIKSELEEVVKYA